MSGDSDAYEFLRDGLLDLLDPDGDLDGDAAEESILLDAVKALHVRAERAEAEVARLRALLDEAVDVLRRLDRSDRESLAHIAECCDGPPACRKCIALSTMHIADLDANRAFLAALSPDEGTEP